ncbi:MAG: threonylcarbamoyl-AMP synthase [Abitibacteriaceae bacterium]|nr:threonylcarbamoyl-AMP synthase [Abditibacteriaceae bacterium]MBV9865478.1 threonylcarbamoyl-AMP synthase [Abditibacteriaceae bacterium]
MTQPLIETSDIEIIQRGGLVIYPTETLYGLGCCATDEAALQRLFQVKGRALGQPPPVLVSGMSQLHLLVASIPDIAAELINTYWPGALTLILPANPTLSPLLTGANSEAGVRTIGVRQSAHPMAKALCERIGTPLVATSANYSGATGREATPHSLNDIPQALRQSVDVVLDGGNVAGQPSTIVDCTSDAPRVLRQGALQVSLG